MRATCVWLVAVCIVLAVAPAFGNWLFWYCENSAIEAYGYDALFYQNDWVNLVEEGALVQFIIGLNGAEIVDPIEHFDYNHSGRLDWGTYEHYDMMAWIHAGADPSAISGGTNVLCWGPSFSGETSLDAPGYFVLDPVLDTGNPYTITPGYTFDKIAYRVWSLSKTDIMTFSTRPLEELWYMTGRELGTHNNQGGGPDTGWWLGMPGVEGGGAPAPGDWAGFNGLIVWELAGLGGWRDNYYLNRCLAVCIPEPGTMLLIGGSVLLLLLRRKK